MFFTCSKFKNNSLNISWDTLQNVCFWLSGINCLKCYIHTYIYIFSILYIFNIKYVPYTPNCKIQLRMHNKISLRFTTIFISLEIIISIKVFFVHFFLSSGSCFTLIKYLNEINHLFSFCYLHMSCYLIEEILLLTKGSLHTFIILFYIPCNLRY